MSFKKKIFAVYFLILKFRIILYHKILIFSEPSLDKDCIVFKVSDSNTVQDMALEWRTYDCTQAKDAIPICQFSTSNFDIKIDEPQGTFSLISFESLLFWI